MSTKGVNEKMKTKLEEQRKEQEMKRIFLENEKKETEVLKKRAEDLLAKREKEYQDALDSMPSGWSLLAMRTVEGAAEGLSMGMSAFATRGIGAIEKATFYAAKGLSKAADFMRKEEEEGGSGENLLSINDRMQYSSYLMHHPEALNKVIDGMFKENKFSKDLTDLHGLRQHIKSALSAATSPEDGVGEDLCKRVVPFYNDVLNVLEKIEQNLDNTDIVKDV